MIDRAKKAGFGGLSQRMPAAAFTRCGHARPFALGSNGPEAVYRGAKKSRCRRLIQDDELKPEKELGFTLAPIAELAELASEGI
jgi:hypothetical protein